MLTPESGGSDAYVEADPGTRWRFLVAVVVALGVAAALAVLALRPPPAEGDPSLNLPALAQRALWSALVVTALALAAGVVVLKTAARAVRTGQWPPAGMRMPFRTRVQALRQPGVAWGVAGAIVVALFAVAVLYWLHYAQAREWAGLFGAPN